MTKEDLDKISYEWVNWMDYAMRERKAGNVKDSYINSLIRALVIMGENDATDFNGITWSKENMELRDKTAEFFEFSFDYNIDPKARI